MDQTAIEELIRESFENGAAGSTTHEEMIEDAAFGIVEIYGVEVSDLEREIESLWFDLERLRRRLAIFEAVGDLRSLWMEAHTLDG